MNIKEFSEDDIKVGETYWFRWFRSVGGGALKRTVIEIGSPHKRLLRYRKPSGSEHEIDIRNFVKIYRSNGISEEEAKKEVFHHD
ncbi:hypothetical protein [Paenibacillus senegalensis]|uniref:hypothetical protein n=1 Tax=Paenibacillus senegalensis TaxID=1465766 RepID=UPI000289F1B6|nr:hypothetical protein [Paenibacillus senegalensis]